MKKLYEVVEVEVISFPQDDVIRTSLIDDEVGGGWDNEGWGE